MLVRIIERARRARDEGSALVSVMIVMFVLLVGGLALATIVANTSTVLASTRGTVQSRAAADAGLADALATAMRDGGFCPSSDPTRFQVFVESPDDRPEPDYVVRSRCEGGRAYFAAVGAGVGNVKTATLAEFEYVVADASTEGLGEMIFFSSAVLSGELRINAATSDLLSIVVPSGNFTCRTTLPANIIVNGNVTGNGGCRILGDVYGGGSLTVNGSDVFEGNVTMGGTTTADIQGKVYGDIHVGGGINFGWTGWTYPGNVTVGGSVNMSSISIGKRLKIPSSAGLQRDGWVNITPPTSSDARIAGGIDWLASATPPAPLTFDPWFEFTYEPDDWPAFTNVITLINSGDGPGTCGYFNQNNGNAASPNQRAKGWRDLAELTSPTVIDARACSSLTSNNGTMPNVAIKTDILFIAKKYDLNSLTMTAAAGATPRLWWTVEDPNPNGAPTCTGGAGDIIIEKTSIAAPIISMGYTPCTVNVTGSTNSSQWTGSFYGGGFNYGGGLTFTGDRSIGLPGMVADEENPAESSGSLLGGLVSQRDIPLAQAGE
jgi:hypothetical protein